MITLEELRKSKLGMTLIEMVVSLVILSILMTSTMGMIISSSNVFIATSQSALDKQVGNSVFDLLEKMIKYTTHLEISDKQSESMNQGFSIVTKDEETNSGYLYYKREKAEDPVPMYDSAFYNSTRTLQYELNPVGKDGKHVDLIVRVFRNGKQVYSRNQVIRCVNLALVGGATGNSVFKSDSAPTVNPYLSFSCDEMLFAGGKAAWTIEYKVNSYIAKYNAILKDYYNHLTAAINPVNTMYDTYYNLGKNSHLKKSALDTAVHTRNTAIWGVSEDAQISTAKNISNNGDLPDGVKWDNGSDPTKWNNIRAHYQQEIYQLLNFTPQTIQDADDFYYGVIASKEELYAGFLLTYYSENDQHKKVTKDTYPTFDDPAEFFGSTTLSKYAVPSSSNNQDKMVILGYFVDDSNDFSTTGNILRRSTYTDPYYKLEKKTGNEQLMVTTGLTDEGSGRSTRIASGNLKRYGTSVTTPDILDIAVFSTTPYEIQENYDTTVIDTTKNHVLKTNFTLSNKNNSESTGRSENVGTYFTTPGESTVNTSKIESTNNPVEKSSAVITNGTMTFYYPTATTTVTKTPTNRSYTKYSLTNVGKTYTISSTDGQTDTAYKYSTNSLTTYDYSASTATSISYPRIIEVDRYGVQHIYEVNYYMNSTSNFSTNSSVNSRKIQSTPPTSKTETFNNDSFSVTQENNYNSWKLKSQELITALGAKDILSVANLDSTKTVYTSENTSKTAPNVSSATRYVFIPKNQDLCGAGAGNITEGWYYYLEGTEGSTQAYHFFYLDAKSYVTTIGDPDNPDTYYDPEYHVNSKGIAVSLSAERDNETACEIQLFSKNWNLKYVSYDRADYVATDEGDGKVVKTDVNYYTVKCHQYTDWYLYSVDWTSWFSQDSTGLINKLIGGIKKLFTGDTSISNITADNAIYSLGCTGTYTVNNTDTDLRSFQAAWLIYHPGRGTWYYIPQESSRISTTLSGLTWYSAKDGPTLLDLTSWSNSTAMQNDVNTRKLSSSAVFGLVDTTTDINWTSLPANTEKAS